MRSFIVALVLIGLIFPAPGVWCITDVQAQSVPKAAVLDFIGEDVDVGSVDLVADLLRQELGAGGRVDLVSASSMRSRLAGAVRCYGKGCALSGGRTLGVTRVVVGKVSRSGNPFRLELRAYDVATGEIVSSLRRDLESEDALFLAVPGLAGTVTEWIRREVEKPPEITPTPTPTPTPVPTPQEPVPAAPTVSVQHSPVRQGTEGQPLDLEATVPNLSEGYQVLVMYRVVGDGRLRYTQMRSRGGDRFSGQIPANRVMRSGLEYYIDIVDAAGNLVTRTPEGDGYYSVNIAAGSGAPPQPVDDRRDDQPTPVVTDGSSSSKKWWLIGGLAAAAGVVVALVAGGGGGGDGDDTPVFEELPEPPAHK